MSIDNQEIDFGKEASEFNMYIDTLYSKIEKICSKLDPVPATERSAIQIEEPPHGSYNSEKMTIKTNSNKIIFSPIGTMLMGFKGQIRIFDERNQQTIFLLDDRKTSLKDIANVKINFNESQINNSNNSQKEHIAEKINWVWKAIPHKNEGNTLSDKFIPIDEDFIDNLVKQ